MTATYYSIRKNTTGKIVDKGIIRDSEDTIYPGQNTGIEELPSECEAHKFKSDEYTIDIYKFSITREEMFKRVFDKVN